MKKGFSLAIYNSIDKNYFLELIDFCLELKVDIVKLGICWHDIEKEKGVYNWETTDFFVNTIIKNNIEILANITTFPCWTNGIGKKEKDYLRKIGLPYFDGLICIKKENYQYYEKYLQELITRYSYIKYWEIINEPFGMGLPIIENNQIQFGKTFKEYIELLMISYETIKEIDKTKLIGLGSIDGNADIINHINCEYYDAICLHPYRRRKEEIINIEMINEIKKIMMLKNIIEEKQIWITEYGWEVRNPKHPLFINEEKQGEYLKETFKYFEDFEMAIFNDNKDLKAKEVFKNL